MFNADEFIYGPSRQQSRARRSGRAAPIIDPLMEQGMIRSVGNKAVGGLSKVGALLDIPASMARDTVGLIAGVKNSNPFDQLLTPFSHENRTRGKDIVRQAGLAGPQDSLGKSIAGFALEVGLDPLTYLTFGGSALTKAGQAAKAAGLMDNAVGLATRNAGAVPGAIGKRQARTSLTAGDLFRDADDAGRLAFETAAKKKGLNPADLMDQKLGGMVGVGLPFRQPSFVMGGGQWASGMDKVADVLGNNPVAREGKRLFSAGVREAVSKPFQAAARTITGKNRLATAANRQFFFDATQELERVMPGLHDDDVLLRQLAEGVVDVDDLAGKIPDTEAARAWLGKLRTQLDEGIQNQQKAGNPIDELGGEFVGGHYAPRGASGVQRSPAAGKSVASLDPAQLAREDALKNIEGGSGNIKQILQHPELAKLHADGASRKEIKEKFLELFPDALWSARDDVAKGVLPSHPEWTTHLARFAPSLYHGADAATAAGMLAGKAPAKLPLSTVPAPNANVVIELDSAFRGRIQQAPGWEDAYRAGSADFLAEVADPSIIPQAVKSITLRPGAANDPAYQQLIQNVKPLLSDADETKRWTIEAGQSGETILRRPKGAESLVPKVKSPSERLDSLVDKIKQLSPKAMEEGLFGNHVMVDVLNRLNSGSSATNAANAVVDTLVPLIRAGDDELKKHFRSDETTTLASAMREAGLDVGTAGKPGRALERLVASTGMAPEALHDMKVPLALREELGRQLKPFKGPEPVSKAMGAIDNFSNLWKGSLTGLWPSFHSRNLTSGTVRNAMDGGFSPRAMREADALVRGGSGQRTPDFTDIPEVQRRLKAKHPGRPVSSLKAESADEMRQLLAEHELLGRHTGVAQDVVGGTRNAPVTSTGEIMSELPGGVGGSDRASLGSVARKATFRDPNVTKNPLHQRGVGGRDVSTFGLAAAGDEASFMVEGINRAAPFIKKLRDGVSPAEAAQQVKNAQVDYSGKAFTRFERDGVARAIPFAKFSKGNAAYVAKALSEKPGGKMAQTIRAINSGRGGDQLTPDYVAESASIPMDNPLANAVFGAPRAGDRRYLTGLGLMMEDPFQFGGGGVRGTLLEGASRMNPLLKAPAEWAVGESFFQKGPSGGRQIEDMDPTIGRTLSNVGQMVSGDRGRTDPVTFPGSGPLEFVFGNSPLSRLGTTARQLTDPRKGWGAKALNTLTGARITDVSPEASEAILREKAREIMKDHGAKTFERTYVNEETLAGLSPEARQEVLEYQALMNMLAKRAKERALSRN